MRKTGVLYYVHGDHLGSTTRVTDASGNFVDSTAYTAFGETRSGGAGVPTDRRFTGQIMDLSTGLYWVHQDEASFGQGVKFLPRQGLASQQESSLAW